MILISLGSIAFVSLLLWALVRFTPDAKPTFTAKDQSYLELTREDDYYGVTRRLGIPSADRWKPGEGELKYRALFYRDRGYAIILMGTEQGGRSLHRNGWARAPTARIGKCSTTWTTHAAPAPPRCCEPFPGSSSCYDRPR